MDSIKCVFITPKDFDSVVEFVRYHFLQDEPLCHSLKLGDSHGLDEYFRHSIEQGTSVMAIDTANGDKIVGVRGHRVERRSDQKVEEEKTDSTEDNPCTPLLDLVDYAFHRYNPWTKLDVDSLLYFKFLSVHKDYRGRNISVKMMEVTFDFMLKENIPIAYVLATSKYSQAVFIKTGFQVVDEMNYEDYKVDGKVVFHPEAVHTKWATLIKWI